MHYSVALYRAVVPSQPGLLILSLSPSRPYLGPSGMGEQALQDKGPERKEEGENSRTNFPNDSMHAQGWDLDARCNVNRRSSPSTGPLADKRRRKEGRLAGGASTCMYSTVLHLGR